MDKEAEKNIDDKCWLDYFYDREPRSHYSLIISQILLILLTIGTAFGSYMFVNLGNGVQMPDYDLQAWDELQDPPIDVNDPNEGEPAPENSPTSYIGIPEPNWGGYNPMTELTYRIYDDDADPNVRNPDLTYYPSDSGGFYTAYVYEDGPNSPTDSSNPYGTEAKPRRTIPTQVPYGSIIEVHGEYTDGYDPYSNYIMRIRQDYGTEESPIFIRGVDASVYGAMQIRINGAYYIIEGIDFNDVQIKQYLESSSGVLNNVMIRDCNIHNASLTGGSTMQFGNSNSNDIIVYNNEIHHNGNVPITSDSDVHGVLVGGGVERVWIINNTMWRNDGDSVQVAGSETQYPQYIYIAGNTFYEDRENAVDLKTSRHVIISENTAYGYTQDSRLFGIHTEALDPTHHGTPTAYITGNEGNVSGATMLSWCLFNRIYDSFMGIRADTPDYHETTYVMGNLIYDCDIGVYTAKDANMYLCSNIISDVKCGFIATNNDNDNGVYTILNNIFYDQNGIYNYYSADKWVEVQRAAAIANTSIENSIFYIGDGFTLGSTTYDTVSALIAGSATGTGCMQEDPNMTDPLNGDFTLAVDSPVFDIALADDINDWTGYFYDQYGIDINTPTKNLFTIGDINAPNL